MQQYLRNQGRASRHACCFYRIGRFSTSCSYGRCEGVPAALLDIGPDDGRGQSAGEPDFRWRASQCISVRGIPGAPWLRRGESVRDLRSRSAIPAQIQGGRSSARFVRVIHAPGTVTEDSNCWRRTAQRCWRALLRDGERFGLALARNSAPERFHDALKRQGPAAPGCGTRNALRPRGNCWWREDQAAGPAVNWSREEGAPPLAIFELGRRPRRAPSPEPARARLDLAPASGPTNCRLAIGPRPAGAAAPVRAPTRQRTALPHIPARLHVGGNRPIALALERPRHGATSRLELQPWGGNEAADNCWPVLDTTVTGIGIGGAAGGVGLADRFSQRGLFAPAGFHAVGGPWAKAAPPFAPLHFAAARDWRPGAHPRAPSRLRSTRPREPGGSFANALRRALPCRWRAQPGAPVRIHRFLRELHAADRGPCGRNWTC